MPKPPVIHFSTRPHARPGGAAAGGGNCEVDSAWDAASMVDNAQTVVAKKTGRASTVSIHVSHCVERLRAIMIWCLEASTATSE